jgi:hypothetical protein
MEPCDLAYSAGLRKGRSFRSLFDNGRALTHHFVTASAAHGKYRYQHDCQQRDAAEDEPDRIYPRGASSCSCDLGRIRGGGRGGRVLLSAAALRRALRCLIGLWLLSGSVLRKDGYGQPQDQG